MEKLSVEVLALRREVLGDKHPHTLAAMHSAAIILDARQRYSGSEAFTMMQECFRLQCEVLGETHPSTQRTLDVLNRWGPTGESMKRKYGWFKSFLIDHTRNGSVWKRDRWWVRKLYFDVVGWSDKRLLAFQRSPDE